VVGRERLITNFHQSPLRQTQSIPLGQVKNNQSDKPDSTASTRGLVSLYGYDMVNQSAIRFKAAIRAASEDRARIPRRNRGRNEDRVPALRRWLSNLSADGSAFPRQGNAFPRLLGGKRNLFSFQGTPGEIRSLFIEACTLRPSDCQTRKLKRKAEERERRSKRRMCSGDKNGPLPSVSAARADALLIPREE
jgi:hypothetical protein